MSYKIKFSRSALKDYELVKQSTLKKKVKELLEVLEKNPFQNPPPFEKLRGTLREYYSRRINGKHRLVYRVEDMDVLVVAMWSHYETI